MSHLFDFSLQVAQLHTLLQMSAVLLCSHIQLLLFLMQELQQILNPCGHVHVSVTQQLNA